MDKRNNNNNNNDQEIDNNIILKYNEIPLKSFSDHPSNQWREFTIEVPNSASNNSFYRDEVTKKFSSTPYRSGGFNFKKSSLTNGRFIVWRVINNGSVLELSEHYLHHSLEGNQIRVHFINSSIIGDIFIQEFNEYVVIMFTTLSKSIYRFILPHPNVVEYSDPSVGNKRKTSTEDIRVNHQSQQNRNFKSIFSNLNNSSLDNQWSRVRSVVPDSFDMTVIRYFSPTKLIIGSSSSGSVFIELSDVRQGGEISLKRFDCKENQGFFSWKWGEKQEYVQDIQLFNYNSGTNSWPLAFILQNNSKLRVWSANEKRFLNDLTIYPESWSNNEQLQSQQQQNSQQSQSSDQSDQQQQQFILSTHKRFKIYPKSNNSFLMIVFFELESESHFQFYSGSLENFNGSIIIQYKQERFSFIKAKGLIDFNIHNGYLYSLWNQENNDNEENDGDNTMDQDDEADGSRNKTNEKILSLKHIYIGNPESENVNMEFNQFFNSQMSNNIDKLYESTQLFKGESDQSFYFDQLFNRSLFSPIAIETALKEYRGQIVDAASNNDMAINDDYNSLETLVVNTVNQEDLRYNSKDQWSNFYRLCVKYQKSICLTGSGLFIESSSSIIFLIRSNQLSIMKPMSKLECFFSKSLSNNSQVYDDEEGQNESDELFNQIVDQSFGSNKPVLVHDLLYLMKCCSYINSYVQDNFRSFEYELSHSAINFALLGEAEKLITVWENHENFSAGLIKLFQSIQEPFNSIEKLLEKFNEEFKNHNNMTIPLQSQVSARNTDKAWAGELFSDILTNSFQQSIEMKFNVLSGLSLLIACISHLRTQLNLDPQVVFDIEKDSLPQAFKLLSNYYILNWFNRQNYIKSIDNTEFDKIYLNEQQQQSSSSQKDQDKSSSFIVLKNTNILSILINNHLNQFTSKLTFFDNIECQISKLLCVLVPRNDIFSLCCYLVEKNQYKHLNEILKIIFNNQVNENIAPFYYLMGICNAHFSKFNEAYQCLIKATESIENENPEMLRICSISRDELICNLFVDISKFDQMYTKEVLISNYYFKCIKIFETRGQPELIIQISLFAVEHLNRNKEDFIDIDYTKKLESLYSLIFKYSLKINKYDLAFTAATQNPNKEISNENKRRLILTLCENAEIKDLCTLPFSQKDIEDHLLVLASSQDLNKKPDYHTILYAYYISRCNYRNAAVVFYERSLRIDIEGLGKSRGKSIYDQQKLLDAKLELLSTTINSLKLLDSYNQWIEVDSSLVNKSNIGTNKQLNYAKQQTGLESKDIFTLDAIEKHYSYYLACKHLSQVDSQVNCDFVLSPHQLLEELIGHSLYDIAFSLAISHEFNLGVIFESFALNCVQLQLNPQSNPFVVPKFGIGFDISKYYHYNDNIKVAWKVLEDYLERYDTDADLDCLPPSIVNENSQKQSQQELVANNQQKPIKMVGLVQEGSLVDRESNGCSFHIVDTKNFYLDVQYNQRVPPFFKEGEQVIVIGKMEGGKFIADKVLAKKGQVRYHESVAETILFEGSLDLPSWLIQWFNNGRQEILFKLYFKYSRLLEASNTLISLFNQATIQLNNINNNNNNNNNKTVTFNIPYDLIDRFLIESKKILKSNVINDKEKQPLDDSIKSLEQIIINYLSKLN
ncbi:hypothetical protein DICPUDRAFT_150265 [Dictyostelium purpureum]|uniref:Uncharacterized protein n=1 Tax=Dictyostelium purpureum TaxID=5786 RepID=F0ZFW1_DICPU|nr:uncharacterized protein DICPUDRAFT_150265 [Dictyostelium purpureum]EGC37182.1 hypothetical protein DICPUDRAFT_150265 [Dictyostelium purpureum]|eukprot:XP_003286310.1 hypothetical protein DICPUDRAFT_150265 [Dictyostelium purpureum]